MMQIIEQTYEEKMAMYMKLSKKELAQMLIEANKHLDARAPQIIVNPAVQPYVQPPWPLTTSDPIWINPVTFCGAEPTFTITTN